MKDANMIWSHALNAIRQSDKVSAGSFNTWFTELKPSFEDNMFVLNCPNDFTKDWLYEHYAGILTAAVDEAFGNHVIQIGLRTVSSVNPAESEPERHERLHLLD